MHNFEPLTAVVLIDKDMGIGNGKDLLLHCKQFKERQLRLMKTHPIIMGRHAYELFSWDELPDQVAPHIMLLSKTAEEDGRAEIYRSVADLIAACPRRAMVFGGERTYRALLPYCDSIMACHAGIDLPADKKFPVQLGKDKRWRECERSQVLRGGHKWDISCQFVDYQRDPTMEPVRWPDERARAPEAKKSTRRRAGKRAVGASKA